VYQAALFHINEKYFKKFISCEWLFSHPGFRRKSRQSKQLPHWGTREQGGQVLRLLESHLAVLPGLPRRLIAPEHRDLQLVCVSQRQQHLCTDKARDRLLALLQDATLEESRQQLFPLSGHAFGCQGGPYTSAGVFVHGHRSGLMLISV
jgi:hypothetical protein